MYSVVFLETAWKELQRLPSPVQRRIERAIDALAGVPRPPGCTKLAGEEDLYRIRVADYRVIYQLRDDRLLVVVVRACRHTAEGLTRVPNEMPKPQTARSRSER